MPVIEVSVHAVAALLVIHFVADFLFQTNWQAVNKSKDPLALTSHVITYSLPFIVFGPLFFLITFVTHFATDFFTSKAVAYFNKKEKRKAMFVTIGADQLIHGLTLVYTYALLSHYGLITTPV